MSDPIEPYAAPEILFDAIHDVTIIESVVRIVLVTKQNGQTIVVARLAIPISELPDVIQALVISLTEAARSLVKPVVSTEVH